MLRLGVDFGTTNSVVALTDRSGVQVLQHRLYIPEGPEVVEPLFPSLVAAAGPAEGDLLFGLEAEAEARRAGHRSLRSVKRHLGDYFEGRTVTLDGQPQDLRTLLTNLLAALRRSALDSAGLDPSEETQLVATVPANANGAQRWITRRALIDAGWSRRPRLIDEPTAAALDLVGRALRRRRGQPPEPLTVLVYDLGGGTFDASLVRIEGEQVEVLSNDGIWQLGGDDFDAALAELVAEAIDLDLATLSPLLHRTLLSECRRAKESLAAFPRLPKRLLLSLGDLNIAGRRGSEARIPLEAFERRIAPALDQTLEVVDEVLEGFAPPDRVYMVGGSTLLPFVGRALSARYPGVTRGNRPFESIAVGAALCHDLSPSRITHRLARNFGVLRVGGADHGHEYVDVLFPRGAALPPPGQVTVARRGPYRPYFDIGQLQFLECSTVTPEGHPGRNRRDWQQIHYPYDPSIARGTSLDDRQPRRRDDLAVTITEEYLLDSDGIISVRVRRSPDGYSERHEVYG